MSASSLPMDLAAIVDCMHDGLFIVGLDGTILMVNDALLRLTGHAREELEGQSCAVLGCDRCSQVRDRCGDHWCQLFADGGHVRQYCHIFTRSGACLKVLKSSRLVHDADGRVVASVENVTDISELLAAEQRIVQLENRLDLGRDFCGLVGRSAPMRALFSLIEKAAQSDAAVIIHGESGTGKELVAHAIHRLGPRRGRPYVQINCAAFNESLLESELFGHVRGAFTGAHRHRIGRFEEARDGDLFLDEIGDIPLPTQVKLLRVLETRRFERVGDNQTLPMDARLISATNQDLDRLIAEGRFRQDFFFRINVIPLRVPALRDRREDIPLLVDHFLTGLRERTGRALPGLTPEALDALVRHRWPGNVRELRSVLEYASVVCRDGLIDRQHLPILQETTLTAMSPAGPAAASGVPAADRSATERAQREELIAALRSNHGNKSATARALGVTRVTVLNRMRKYGIDLQTVLVTS
ncbi:MAG: sigma 54-interacting transcriptional regulator [Candidatus Krumholzibacteriia bacterium]